MKTLLKGTPGHTNIVWVVHLAAHMVAHLVVHMVVHLVVLIVAHLVPGNSEFISRQDCVDQQNLIKRTPGCQVSLPQTFKTLSTS